MGVETAALVITAAAAATSTGVSIANYEAGQSQAAAAKHLADQQAAQLQQEQADQAAQAATQAKTGSTFGFDGQNPAALSSGFGFGAVPRDSPNSGRQQITGMG